MIRSLFLFLIWLYPTAGFKSEQKQFPRVKAAYDQKYDSASKIFAEHKLDISSSEIIFKVHKLEKELQLWARKSGSNGVFSLIRKYKVCALSGNAGPKRMIGDMQTPEGFYYIDRFNPSSSYHLSLGINYPNSCDKFNSGKSNPGGDIFIHGKCVTIGCLPMTDDQINELYVIAVEARNAGQLKIPVAIFPCDMSSKTFQDLLLNPSYSHYKSFWFNLKQGFDYFETNRKLPVIRQTAGEYHFN